MIKKITYVVKFPVGASFKKPIQYLFLKGLYNEIKQKTCLNEKGDCNECERKNDCIYYKLSGEDFLKYPSIIIKKGFLERTVFSSKESIKITFFVIGNGSIYDSFIDEYYLSKTKLCNKYFMKVKSIDEIIDERELVTSKVRFLTPLLNENYEEQLKYYNEKYGCSFNIHFEMTPLQTMIISDETKYSFSNQFYINKGQKGIFQVNDYPKILLEMGIGTNNLIGGGTCKCELD